MIEKFYNVHLYAGEWKISIRKLFLIFDNQFIKHFTNNLLQIKKPNSKTVNVSNNTIILLHVLEHYSIKNTRLSLNKEYYFLYHLTASPYKEYPFSELNSNTGKLQLTKAIYSSPVIELMHVFHCKYTAALRYRD